MENGAYKTHDEGNGMQRLPTTTIASHMRSSSLPFIASICTLASCGGSSWNSSPPFNINNNGLLLFAPPFPPRQRPSLCRQLPRRRIGWWSSSSSSSSSSSLVYHFQTQYNKHNHPCFYSFESHTAVHGFGSTTTRRLRRDRLAFRQVSFKQSESSSYSSSSSSSSSLSMSSLESTSESTTRMIDDDDDNVKDSGTFDNAQFIPYAAAITEILSKRNVMRDFRKHESDLGVVKELLLERRRVLPQWDIVQFVPTLNAVAKEEEEEEEENDDDVHGADGKDHIGESTGTFSAPPISYAKQKLRQRSQMYLNVTGITPSQQKLATVLLAHLVDHCAKHSTPVPLHVAWEKVLEGGLVPLSRTLSTYLYVLSLEDNNNDNNNNKESKENEGSSETEGKMDDKTYRRDIAAEVAMFHDAIYPPTEKTITLLVKSLVSRGDARGAEALLESIADNNSNGQLRHRTTSPILRLYCEQGDIDSALRLYHKMRSTSRVKMDASTYANFIAAVAQHGYFRSDSNCLLSAQDLGYSQSCGPDLLNSLLSEMAEDVLDISEDSARVLHNGFALGFREFGLDVLSDAETMNVPTTTRCDDGRLVANRVLVDTDSAICAATGATLRLIVLEQSQRVHVHDTLLEMAREKSKEYTAKLASKGRSSNDNAEKAELATQILKEFSVWLDTRSGKPYTAIVDGANVAYFGWGRVNVYQLMHMVNALERQGEHPLVIFPQKYTLQRFHLRQGVIQVLREEELAYLEELKERGQMYVVPPMCLDDLYWMLASVSNQTISTHGQTINVPKDNPDGRYPGLRPMVITNDKMRDHKMELLEERSFRRWCCSHIVNYNFTEYIENSKEERTICFHAADLFSDEIQCNIDPSSSIRSGSKSDDGDDSGGGMVWHFPVSEWSSNERFCLRLPTRS